MELSWKVVIGIVSQVDVSTTLGNKWQINFVTQKLHNYFLQIFYQLYMKYNKYAKIINFCKSDTIPITTFQYNNS